MHKNGSVSNARRHVESAVLLRSHGERRLPTSPTSPSTKPEKKLISGLNGGSNPSSPKSQPRLSQLLLPFEDMRTGRNLETLQPTGGFYRLGVELAQGAQGDVFAAVSVCGGHYTQVAAKRVRVLSGSHRRHVLNEVETAYLCRNAGEHENVIRYLDWFPGIDGLDREIYLVMERCDFGLDDFIRAVRETRSIDERKRKQFKGSTSSSTLYRFSEAEIGKLLKEMVAALDFLNGLGIIHQDVKADNILWKHSCDMDGVYKLCDFGVIGFAEPADGGRLTVLSTKGSPGTLWTQAPEVLREQKRDASCDIWSLGCVLYEVAYLEKPFNSIELMAYRNDGSACLANPIPPVRIRKSEELQTRSQIGSPSRKPLKTHSLGGFSPPKPHGENHRGQPKWIYSAALKALLVLCFTMKVSDRPTPTQLLTSEEYLTTFKAISDGECAATVSSPDFYRSLLKQYMEKKSLAAFTFFDGDVSPPTVAVSEPMSV
eukprot:GEMP01032883.1.p1 GENE.GEMP01032883.1~~GEMP01032883.1.p1  ORF type:complete len:486 (+),score=72.08 GEMP01032883.1:400-1857(+)